MEVILDTNFLIYCAKEKLDYVDELRDLINENYELVVPEQVIEELERLKIKAKKGKDKNASDLALKILKNNQIKKINGNKIVLVISGSNISIELLKNLLVNLKV